MLITENAAREFLISIKPYYADKIVDGFKTVELRRRFSDEVGCGSKMWIYSTSPTQAIVGVAEIQEVKRLTVAGLWQRFGSAACIDRVEFLSYFSGLDVGYAIVLSNAHRLKQAVTASRLKKRFGFVPPQSFMYLRPDHSSLLKHEQLHTLNRH